jgi:hypothetical protein
MALLNEIQVVYSGEYKLKVLNWMHTYHKSYPYRVLRFNISPSTIPSSLGREEWRLSS